ncbi:entry-fusion complex component, myristylprotein [Mythimna separata entomopoxvirus 'L']|uniref:Entry-fusion complex component, myristylprotein n=1 Tax=Mythimna separata entomopoxvirus 'L' TaxID=1293572 RepID=A0A916NY95_9POXV|nr:entry-fusion complex component, myristylprotein [Mythimna separata entomopoxvirus 'L']CCU56258.1 entry-fusion complex component, myristylprotein [Mythimna separata entomopoxvirus 'L']
MGGSVDIDTRYGGSSAFQETFLSFSNLINTIYILTRNERIPIGIYSNNINDYTNYRGYNPIFKPGGYVELSKNNDVGPDDLCCIYDWRYAWVDGNEQLSQNASLFKQLYTCDPRTIQVGTNNICDESMYKACILNFNTYRYLKPKCGVWLDGLYRRYQTSISIINNINNILIESCSNSINNDLCDIWLMAIRNSGNPVFFRFADNVLIAQKDKTNLKCAFPPNYIIETQNRLSTPKECWYRECAFSPNYLLLTDNIILKNNCSLSECNINIGNLDVVNATEISITCNNNTNNTVTSKQKYDILLKESEDYRFLLTNNILILILLFILFIFIIIRHN